MNSKNNLIISAGIVLGMIAVAIFLSTREEPMEDIPVEILPIAETEKIEIKKVEILEDNFTGTMPVITGRGELADAGKKYVESTVYDFKIQANKDVPEMRAQFGFDSPSANYTLDIEANHLEASATQSIVISTYAYTGGANGNSLFKVFTASNVSGKVLTLSDIVKDGQERNFTELVKKNLMQLGGGDGGGSAVFPDVVKDLAFHNFSNWSMDDKNLTLYFAKYEVGPGAMGAIMLPIPLVEMGGMLETTY